MKIKNDFVTNSSSTSYVVAIPSLFGFSKSEVEIILENASMEVTDDEMEVLMDDIDLSLSVLKHGGTTSEKDLLIYAKPRGVDEGRMMDLRFLVLKRLLLRYVIHTRELRVEIPSQIMAIPLESLRKGFMRICSYDAEKIFKEIKERKIEDGK